MILVAVVVAVSLPTVLVAVLMVSVTVVVVVAVSLSTVLVAVMPGIVVVDVLISIVVAVSSSVVGVDVAVVEISALEAGSCELEAARAPHSPFSVFTAPPSTKIQ